MKNNSVFENYKQLVKEAIEDLKTKGRRHKQIPNILTLMRLTAPCFIIPATIIGNVPLVIGLTAFFGLTDFADGKIASKWELKSELGAALDAVTDKVFASTLLLAASVSNPMLLCNLALEGVIASINVSKKLDGIEVESSYIGKFKTWFLFALAGAGIVSPHWNMQLILNLLMISTTVMQSLTIYSYLKPNSKNKEQVVEKEKQSNEMPNEMESNEPKHQKYEKEKILETDNSPKQQLEEREDLKALRNIRNLLTQLSTKPEKNEVKKTKIYKKEK